MNFVMLRLQGFEQDIDSACLAVSNTLHMLSYKTPLTFNPRVIGSCRMFFYELLNEITLPYSVFAFQYGQTKRSRLEFSEFFSTSKWLSAFPELQAAALLQMRSSTCNLVESLHRLLVDWQELSKQFGFLERGNVVLEEIVLTDSDRHNNGQQVVMFNFSQGQQSVKVLYKPKQLLYQSDLEVLLKGEYMPKTYITHLGYGWEEFVRYNNITCLQEYYIAAGRLLVAYAAINGTDAHFENIIATRHGPVIIDWETVFTNTSYFKAQGVNTDLVTFTGLVQKTRMPWEFWISKNQITAGYQAFGTTKHQMLGVHSVDDGTNGFRVAYKRDVPYCYTNRPSKVIFNPMPSIIHGLSNGVVDLRSKKVSVLQELEARCSVSNYRQLIRHTAFYKWLILQSLNPGVVKVFSEKARIRFFQSRLKPVFGRSDFFGYEVQCLLRGDIPIFYQNPAGYDLLDGDGGVYRGFFPVTGITCLREKWHYIRTGDFLAKNLKLLKRIQI